MRLAPTLFIPLLSCAAYNPQPDWYSYTDIQQRNHIYNIDLEKLSLSGENLTEYYYCLTHERLEEIQIVWPSTDSTRYVPALQDF